MLSIRPTTFEGQHRDNTMASRTAQRSADEERFREFRARRSVSLLTPFLLRTAPNPDLQTYVYRLEKKEADRLKLTAEFPLLFNNKAVGNKVLSSSMNLNSKTLLSPTGKAPTTPAGKRRSVAADKNDENCAYSANKSATKLSLGAKTPLSSKKQRKGSMIGTKIPISHPSAAKASAPAAVEPIVNKNTTDVITETPVVVAEAHDPQAVEDHPAGFEHAEDLDRHLR